MKNYSNINASFTSHYSLAIVARTTESSDRKAMLARGEREFRRCLAEKTTAGDLIAGAAGVSTIAGGDESSAATASACVIASLYYIRGALRIYTVESAAQKFLASHNNIISSVLLINETHKHIHGSV